MALSRSPDPGHDVPMVKEGECWKLFHKDFWLRTGLDVPHPKERVEVTEDQKRIIRDTWPLVNCHLSENGILVYLHVFQLHSDIKSVFHMGNVPFDQLAAQPGLKMHAVKFMQAIEVVVENLDLLDDVVAPIFLHLGRRHSYFKRMGISVSAVYKSPNEEFSFRADFTVNMVIGNFNNNSVQCGYSKTNDDEELVESWSDASRLSLIHDAKLTSSINCSIWRRGRNPDLVSASNRNANQWEKIVLAQSKTPITDRLEYKSIQLLPFVQSPSAVD
ncbi:hypothetical protein LSAT2_027185 [Lamellibrachia satsuma]|nr:hypothetical protein LSAT2_027185 [Lamellibrachia satsuma]